MTNAFTILGAEPTDNAERLQELLEEKELLLDDTSEAQAAYADLTNPKKRVPHEIVYFSNERLLDFDKLVSRTLEPKPTAAQIAQILVNIGVWFESDAVDLFDTINEARLSSGYPQIEDESVIVLAVENLKQESKTSANSYFDCLTEKSLVDTFNQIVKINNFASFFIDELMSYYELKISETLQEKEGKCLELLKSMNTYCMACFATDSVPTLASRVSDMRTALKDWDVYAQPLQVNMQRHGGQHESSVELARVLRNKLVDICNSAQDSLSSMISDLSYEPTIQDLAGRANFKYERKKKAVEKLPQNLPASITLINQLIELTDLLNSVFAELAIVAEMLKEDKKSLTELRTTLTSLNNQVQEAKREGERRAQMGGSSYSNSGSCCCCDGCYIATSVYGSYDCPEVWVLRRYRDNTLGSTWYGRLFIRLYYAISPTLVKWFGKTKWFQRMWKGYLDRKVSKLQDKGFEDTPYMDINWRKKKN